jgi:hypothetical protein
MTCKDCVHYDACKDMYDGYSLDFDDCDFTLDCIDMGIFKNKADFVEVKHGWWKDTEYGTCSVCNRSISEIYDADSSMAYGILDEITACPFCGADMRKEGADNG